MKRLTVATVALLLIFLFLGLTPTHGEEGLYDNLLRLHVLANSDSESDQALKLKVRDAVVDRCTVLLADCGNREDAERILENSLGELTALAEETVREEGCDYGARVVLCEEEYPTRRYDSLCFPAGRYLSLRILLGAGEGKNWWCVLFPPLCLGAASAEEAEDRFIAAGFTPDQYKIITESDSPTYKIRFKCLEWLQELKAKLEK